MPKNNNGMHFVTCFSAFLYFHHERSCMDDPPNLERPSVPVPKPSIMQGVATAIGIGGPLSAADLAIFAELLVGLVRARLPLPDALRLLASDAESRRLRESLAAVEKDVAGGMPLGEALRKREGEFPPLFTRLIDQGVASNDLHAALVELVREYRSQMKFREALWSQLLSPIATCVCMVVFLIVIIGWNLPVAFSSTYRYWRPKDIPLPALTRAVIWASDTLHRGSTLLYLGGFAILSMLLIHLAFRSKKTRYVFEMFALSLPLVGPYLKTMLLGRFCRVLGILLQQRIPIDAALQMTRDCFTFIPMQQAIDAAMRRVLNGSPLDEAMNVCPLFPATLGQFIRGGQMHGNLPVSLGRLADLYEERGNLWGAQLRMFIYIAAQVTVGLAVGAMIISFFLPMMYWW